MAVPFLYPNGLGADSAITTTTTLPANGGSIAISYLMPSRLMVIPSLTVRTLDTTGSHTLEVMLYADGGEDGPAGRVAGSLNSFTYTAAAAANRTAQLPAPVVLPGEGCYWLIVRNVGAAATALAGPAASAMGANIAATATIPTSLDETSIASATWVPVATCPLVRLNGVVWAVPGVL